MKINFNNLLSPLFWGICFLLVIILIEFLNILHLNHGMFVYTLDDPYIHLALGENILKGHYGINLNEFSAPSSTILWPFIIAPFSSYEYFPFLLNTALSIVAVYFYFKILLTSFRTNDRAARNILVTSILILLILATNMVGLIFTGMEHSLQVLFVSLIAYGLIIEIEKNRVEPWLLIAIVAAPLVRYENLSVSIAALCYLALNKYFRNAWIAAGLLLVLVGGFSLFLLTLGLDPLPASVIAKSPVVGSAGKLHSIAGNIWHALSYRQGVILLIGTSVLLIYLFYVQDIKRKKLALIAILALSLHFMFGRFDWNNRYEIYILTFFLLITLYLFSSIITKYLEGEKRNLRLIKIEALFVIIMFLTGFKYIDALFDLPISSNNIYEQQYQMHRFAVNYYKKSVAINDLGYVSYKNDNYVLDLFGLASVEAFNDRNTRNNSEWMQNLTAEKHIGLAMIYEKWFKSIPDEWIKIGELHLGKRQITPAYSEVSFYATTHRTYSEIVEKLRFFVKTLPADVTFTFKKKNQ